MKTINKIGSLILVAMVCLYGCQDNQVDPNESIPGEVQFSLSEPDDGTRGNAAGAEELEDARSLIVTILDDQGTVIYDQERIELFNFSGTLVGEPLSLNPGNYQLTEFLVLDDQGTVIYATPIEGSQYEHLVNDPLPIDFVISEDVVTDVIPEVIDVEEFTPDAFGYTSFQFTVVDHFNFLITAFVYDESSQSLVPVEANLTVYEQGTANILYSDDLGDSTNAIAVPDGFDYRLVMERNGYTAVDLSFTNTELKAFANDPLEVVLQVPGTLPSNSFVDSGQTFSTEGTDAASGDFDGDGDIDLFITRSNGQPSEVWLNDGNGNFTDSGQAIGSNNSHHIALGDLDADGDLDAFIVNYGNQANTVWLNDGAANFTNSGQALGNSASLFVALGDLDGDGDLDAVIGNDNGVANTIWTNDGNGVFSNSGQVLGTFQAYGVSLGDVDGDSDLDIFLTAYAQPNAVWLNDGAGNFTDSGQLLGNTQSKRVVLVDLDGDLDLDAFVAEHVFNSIPQPSRVWFNDGSGNFTDSGQTLGNNNVEGVILVDFDLDGDMDALTVSYYLEPYTLWLNDGSGSFTDSGQSFGTHFATGVTHADFDGDGDVDFFVTISGSSHKLWLGEQN